MIGRKKQIEQAAKARETKAAEFKRVKKLFAGNCFAQKVIVFIQEIEFPEFWILNKDVSVLWMIRKVFYTGLNIFGGSKTLHIAKQNRETGEIDITVEAVDLIFTA